VVCLIVRQSDKLIRPPELHAFLVRAGNFHLRLKVVLLVPGRIPRRAVQWSVATTDLALYCPGAARRGAPESFSLSVQVMRGLHNRASSLSPSVSRGNQVC
jgi:hypothetical protein